MRKLAYLHTPPSMYWWVVCHNISTGELDPSRVSVYRVRKNSVDRPEERKQDRRHTKIDKREGPRKGRTESPVFKARINTIAATYQMFLPNRPIQWIVRVIARLRDEDDVRVFAFRML